MVNIIIPVRAFRVNYVGMGRNQTAMTLRIGREVWADMQSGVLHEG